MMFVMPLKNLLPLFITNNTGIHVYLCSQILSESKTFSMYL
jgi:hypothetical protein